MSGNFAHMRIPSRSLSDLVRFLSFNSIQAIHRSRPGRFFLLFRASRIHFRRSAVPNRAFIRVLSAPLKLVLDILDLAWDQVVEVAGDIWDTGKKWVGGIVGWCKAKVKWAYDKVMGSLRGIKDKLLKKKEE